ncbi:hypothetical protein D5S18_21120 [Nocardia panacis]|uniref:Transcriptional regulator n=1 Tax=Nocardia panacis TaxID=2340916 RepID=A0A3A4KGT2_9NOCA|nr:hypothetical protein [Nocardia panacis]RJO73679.1 hypothetical protein D5S18_21120 [Nocardia panacis]
MQRADGGSLSVTICGGLVAARVIDPISGDQPAHVRTFEHPLLRALSITALPPGSAPTVRSCRDWTENKPHIAGRLGSTLLTAMLAQHWLRRRPNDRALTITARGYENLSSTVSFEKD